MNRVVVGRITKFSDVATYRDGDAKVRVLQVEMEDPDDIQTVEYYPLPGNDDAPAIGDNVIVIFAGDAWPIAIAIQDSVEPDDTLLVGEKKIYSRIGNVIRAWIKFTIGFGAPVELQLMGDADWAVAFTDMKVAFDQLRTDLNALITPVYNTHVHPDPLAGFTGTPTNAVGAPQLGTPSAADMSPAKVTSVRLP